MTDLAISWSVAGAAIAFLVLCGWRNQHTGYRRRISLGQTVAPVLPERNFVLPRRPSVSVASQLVQFNAALQAEAMRMSSPRVGAD